MCIATRILACSWVNPIPGLEWGSPYWGGSYIWGLVRDLGAPRTPRILCEFGVSECSAAESVSRFSSFSVLAAAAEVHVGPVAVEGDVLSPQAATLRRHSKGDPGRSAQGQEQPG